MDMLNTDLSAAIVVNRLLLVCFNNLYNNVFSILSNKVGIQGVCTDVELFAPLCILSVLLLYKRIY